MATGRSSTSWWLPKLMSRPPTSMAGGSQELGWLFGKVEGSWMRVLLVFFGNMLQIGSMCFRLNFQCSCIWYIRIMMI